MPMFKRKATEKLRMWKEKYSSKYAVLLEGARRVGKSTIAENFAKDLKGAEYFSGSIQEVAEKLYPTLSQGNVVIGIGAGTITNLGKYLQEVHLASRV